MSPSSEKRIKRFIDWLIRSEYAEHARYSNVEENYNDDRRDRCYDAASYGVEGSTHHEVIEDWRDAFFEMMCDRATPFHSYTHFEDAVNQYFDNLVLWHEKNGSLHQEIG